LQHIICLTTIRTFAYSRALLHKTDEVRRMAIQTDGNGMERRAFKISEAAAMFGVHRATLEKAIRDGEIKTVKIRDCVLIPAKEIDRLLKRAS